jgi:hypothetical protein
MQSDPIGRSARTRIAWRLLPFVFLLYVISYVDRGNLSFANLRMSADLGFTDRVYGLCSGIFIHPAGTIVEPMRISATLSPRRFSPQDASQETPIPASFTCGLLAGGVAALCLNQDRLLLL